MKMTRRRSAGHQGWKQEKQKKEAVLKYFQHVCPCIYVDCHHMTDASRLSAE
jgi:hypothetical protein